MKTLLVGMLMFISVPVFSQQPTYVGMDDFGDYFVDEQSIVQIDKDTISIVKTGIMIPEHEDKTKIYMIKGIVQIDCKRKINRVVYAEGTSRDGKTIFKVEDKKRVWEDYSPGHGKQTAAVACKYLLK